MEGSSSMITLYWKLSATGCQFNFGPDEIMELLGGSERIGGERA